MVADLMQELAFPKAPGRSLGVLILYPLHLKVCLALRLLITT